MSRRPLTQTLRARFLGDDVGLAWQWWYLTLGLFLAWFGVLLIVTDGRRDLAVAGALLLVASPFVQFWSLIPAPTASSAGFAVLATVGVLRARSRAAILASGLVRAEANTARFPELLSTRYLSGTETLFKGVFRLLPGHTLVYEGGSVTIRQYWDVDLTPGDGPPLSDEEASARVLAALREAVRKELIADVPVGVLLSGGIDSSAVAALFADPRSYEARSAAASAQVLGGPDFTAHVRDVMAVIDGSLRR